MDLQNQKLSHKNTDIKNKLDYALKVLPNLSTIYSQGNDETKKTLVCSIFNEKLQFQDNAFRTPQLNSALSSILLINKPYKIKKKVKITNKSDLSLKVTAAVHFRTLL